MKNTLTRDDFLTVTPLRIEEIKADELKKDAVLYVREMSGEERDAFEASIVAERNGGRKLNMKNIRAKLAVLTVCDAEGNRLLRDADVEAVGKKSAALLQRIFVTAQRLSGIGDEAVKELSDAGDDPFGVSPSV